MDGRFRRNRLARIVSALLAVIAVSATITLARPTDTSADAPDVNADRATVEAFTIPAPEIIPAAAVIAAIAWSRRRKSE